MKVFLGGNWVKRERKKNKECNKKLLNEKEL